MGGKTKLGWSEAWNSRAGNEAHSGPVGIIAFKLFNLGQMFWEASHKLLTNCWK